MASNGFSTLEIGRRAVTAQRLGLDVVSNNISNINTPYYSRQRAIFVETTPFISNAGAVGTGTIVERIDRFRQEYFDRGIRDNSSRQSAYSAQNQTVKRIEASLNEPSEYGIDAAVKDFFASWQDLSLRPESVDKRQAVIDASNTMITKFKTTATSLQAVRDDTKSRAEIATVKLNGLLRDVADLNIRVNQARAQGNAAEAVFVDKRAGILEQISAITNIQVSITDKGLANVSIAGSTVVAANDASKLQLRDEVDASSGERTLRLAAIREDGTPVVYLSPQSGEIAALTNMYNETLDPIDSSGNFSAAKALDTYAATIVDKVNQISKTGYALGDTSLQSRNFFKPGTASNPITANSMELDSAIVNNPRNIPTSDKVNEPGNNVVAQQIAQLMNDQDFLNGSTSSEYYAQVLASVGTIGSDSENGYKTTALLGDQLNSQREAINGVNLDEEAINLVKYQRGFEASARIINTASEFLQIIVNLGK